MVTVVVVALIAALHVWVWTMGRPATGVPDWLLLDGRKVRGALEVYRSTGRGFGRMVLHGVVPLLAHPLVHAGPVHALSNALVLGVFGGRLESRTSAWRVALFFGACALLAGWFGVFVTIGEAGPRLGATVLAGSAVVTYLLLHPRAWVKLLVFPLPVVVRVPACVVGVSWLLLQFHKVQEFLSRGCGAPLGYRVAGLGVLVGGLLVGPLLLGWRRRSAAPPRSRETKGRKPEGSRRP